MIDTVTAPLFPPLPPVELAPMVTVLIPRGTVYVYGAAVLTCLLFKVTAKPVVLSPSEIVIGVPGRTVSDASEKSEYLLSI